MNSERRDVLTCSLLTIGLICFASEASAATVTAASCSVADIQAAVVMAGDGDTVRVTTGSCTWTTTLTIAKGIELDGQSASITFGSGAGLILNTDAVASTSVTGFTFHNGFINGAYPIAVSTTSAPFNVAFHIYDNVLDDAGQQGAVTLIGVTGFGPGLIDHNTFTTANGADEVIHLLGSGDPSDASGWSNDVVPGGPNMVFLENNVFSNTSTTISSAEEAYYGVQMVFRYNHLSFEQNDVHQGGLSGRWAEIYDNTYDNHATAGVPNYFQFRGGSGMVYANISSQVPCCDDPYPGAQLGPDCPSSDTCTGAWPIPSQIGTGIHETTNSPVYVWGNSATIDGATQSIEDNLQYTNGTQAGATPTSCSHPGSVCDVVATSSAPSSFVRCESAADVSAGCPVSYAYKPYAYPHPLDTLEAACFGAGCGAGTTTDGGSLSDGGSGTDGDSGTDASASTDGGIGSIDSGTLRSRPSGGCACSISAVPIAGTGFAELLTIGSAAFYALLRRRRSATRRSRRAEPPPRPRRATYPTTTCSRSGSPS